VEYFTLINYPLVESEDNLIGLISLESTRLEYGVTGKRWVRILPLRSACSRSGVSLSSSSSKTVKFPTIVRFVLETSPSALLLSDSNIATTNGVKANHANAAAPRQAANLVRATKKPDVELVVMVYERENGCYIQFVDNLRRLTPWT
jgi:hypothetical protein